MNPAAISQIVDPFVPIRRPVLPRRPLVVTSRALASHQARPVFKPVARSIDGIRPFHNTRQAEPQHFIFDAGVPAAQPQLLQPQPVVDFSTHIVLPAQEATRARRLVRHLQWPAIILGAVAVGTLVQSLTIGEIAIGGYAVFALIRRIESRTTFTLALITLASTAVLLAANSNSSLAANFAVYAFLFLVIGTVTLGVELRRSET